MKTVRDAFSLLLVCTFALLLLTPYMILAWPLAQETWVLQTIRELHAGLGLIPTLNGLPLGGQNPLNLLLFSAIPSDSIFWLRSLSLLLAYVTIIAVFGYGRKIWNSKAGAYAALFTVSSLGMLAAGGSLNLQIMPAAFAILAYLLFSQAYLRDGKGYTAAYILMALSLITGGWIYLSFCVLSMLMLPLFDFEPEAFLKIKPLRALLVTAPLIIIFLLLFWFQSGDLTYAKGVLQEEHTTFWPALWSFIKANLPWLPLIIPAWIYAARPDERDEWRSLLPAKVGFTIALLMALFSPGTTTALLSVPFGALLLGYWVSHNFKLPEKLNIIGNIATFSCGLLICGTILVLAIRQLIGGLNNPTIIALAASLLLSLIFLAAFMRRKQLLSLQTLMLALLCGALLQASVLLPAQTEKESVYAQQLTRYTPLVTFEDDLVMRGHLGLAGGSPVVVQRQIAPVGCPAFLAVTSAKPKKLQTELSSRMQVKIEHSQGDYSLLQIAAPNNIQPESDR